MLVALTTTSLVVVAFAFPLGALVRTGDIYGFVAGAGTAGLEPGRPPIARGRDEATEEAVVNALVAAETMTGRDGHTAHALPHDRLIDAMTRYGRGPRPTA